MADNSQQVTVTVSSSSGENTAKVDANSRRGRLYGRKWKVLIYKPAYKTDAQGNTVRDTEHDIAVDVTPFRCVFRVEQKLESAHTILCTLVVYNLNAITEGEFLTEGFQIRIEGGYMEGQYGEIFTGDIVQIYRNRENGVDYRLEIVALRSSSVFDVNHIRSSVAAGSSPRDRIWGLANDAQKTMGVGEVSKALEEGSLPRGKVFFGTPAKYLRELCVGNGAHFWTDESGMLTVKKIDDEIPEDRCLVLTPVTGLVGTPVYSDTGIHIQTLLDPRLKIGVLVKIDNDIIQRQSVKLDAEMGGHNNQLPQQYQFDRDGEYQIASVVHQGDTWGNTWTTDVVGLGRNGRQGLLTATKTPGQSIR